jgi:hypothetical protein
MDFCSGVTDEGRLPVGRCRTIVVYGWMRTMQRAGGTSSGRSRNPWKRRNADRARVARKERGIRYRHYWERPIRDERDCAVTSTTCKSTGQAGLGRPHDGTALVDVPSRCGRSDSGRGFERRKGAGCISDAPRFAAGRCDTVAATGSSPRMQDKRSLCAVACAGNHSNPSAKIRSNSTAVSSNNPIACSVLPSVTLPVLSENARVAKGPEVDDARVSATSVLLV